MAFLCQPRLDGFLHGGLALLISTCLRAGDETLPSLGLASLRIDPQPD
jgi:hypothetical protein